MALPTFAAACCTAVNRYLLPAGPTAAIPPVGGVCCCCRCGSTRVQTDRLMDAWLLHKPCSTHIPCRQCPRWVGCYNGTVQWEGSVPSLLMPSVLWRCWLGGRKASSLYKTEWWGAGMVICLETSCKLTYGPADATATHCLLLQQNPDWFYLSGTGSPG